MKPSTNYAKSERKCYHARTDPGGARENVTMRGLTPEVFEAGYLGGDAYVGGARIDKPTPADVEILKYPKGTSQKIIDEVGKSGKKGWDAFIEIDRLVPEYTLKLGDFPGSIYSTGP